jgi:hypothetical protein
VVGRERLDGRRAIEPALLVELPRQHGLEIVARELGAAQGRYAQETTPASDAQRTACTAAQDARYLRTRGPDASDPTAAASNSNAPKPEK